MLLRAVIIPVLFVSLWNSNCLMETELLDEKETRTATALIALASVACASGIFQGRALFSILRLTTEKQVNMQTVRKVLLAAAQYTTTYVSLIEDNLNYLLTSWIEKAHSSLENFPWTLTGRNVSHSSFIKKISVIY